MTDEKVTHFVTERADFEAKREAGQQVVLAPALHTPHAVRSLAEYYRDIASSAEAISVLNPFSSWRRLRPLRAKATARSSEASALLRDIVRRTSEPTEGSTASDLAWMQGFTLAAGLAAFADLNSAIAAASESLDRKAAYALACFSLYIAVISLIATVVLGVLSLR